jgi:YbbR domain-containing protein
MKTIRLKPFKSPNPKTISIYQFNEQKTSFKIKNWNDYKETIELISKTVIPALKEIEVDGVLAYNQLTPRRVYWSDYPWSYAYYVLSGPTRTYNDVWFGKSPLMIFIVYIDTDNVDEGRLFVNIQHRGITHSIKKKVVEIMKNTFGKNFSWTGKQQDEMRIYWSKITKK